MNSLFSPTNFLFSGDDGICRGTCSSSDNGEEVCVFTMGVDIFASDLGAFYFEECGSDNTYPVIGVEIGKTYKFIQEDKSNYYHPLGFAYHPDGAHVDKEEVEEDYLTYRIDANDVGLDGYEPLFFHSPGELLVFAHRVMYQNLPKPCFTKRNFVILSLLHIFCS